MLARSCLAQPSGGAGGRGPPLLMARCMLRTVRHDAGGCLQRQDAPASCRGVMPGPSTWKTSSKMAPFLLAW